MKKAVGCVLLCSALALSLASCKKSADASSESTSAPSQSTNQRVFQVKGVIKAIRPERKEIEIKHEAIPDYMPAMTMPFDVKDTNELAGLQPQQPISFRLTVTDTEGWVDNIQPLGPAQAGATNFAAPPPIRVVQPLKVGDPLPEFHLTNEIGQTISTRQ